MTDLSRRGLIGAMLAAPAAPVLLRDGPLLAVAAPVVEEAAAVSAYESAQVNFMWPGIASWWAREYAMIDSADYRGFEK
jgi:hypothetical protein